MYFNDIFDFDESSIIKSYMKEINLSHRFKPLKKGLNKIILKENNTMSNLINPISYDAPEKSPEEKQYIVLFVYYDEDDAECHDFSICIGRTEAYREIDSMMRFVDPDTIDYSKSKVLVETKQQTKTGDRIYFISHPDDSLTLEKFIIFCRNEGGVTQNILNECPTVTDYEFDHEENEEPDEKDPTKPEPFYKDYMFAKEFYTFSPFANDKYKNSDKDV